MPTEADPILGNWYRHLDKGQKFWVVALNEDEGHRTYDVSIGPEVVVAYPPEREAALSTVKPTGVRNGLHGERIHRFCIAC